MNKITQVIPNVHTNLEAVWCDVTEGKVEFGDPEPILSWLQIIHDIDNDPFPVSIPIGVDGSLDTGYCAIINKDTGWWSYREHTGVGIDALSNYLIDRNNIETSRLN